MPASFDFVVFSDVQQMRDASAKSQIRRHAMKDIGRARRRPRSEKLVLELRQGNSSKPRDVPQVEHSKSAALFLPALRGMRWMAGAFDGAAIHVDRVTYMLLQYFITYSTSAPANFTYTADIGRVISAALQDELLGNCIVGAAASRMQYVQGDSSSFITNKHLACTHRSLELTRHRLAGYGPIRSEAVNTLVDSVLYLAAAAFYAHDSRAANVHVRAAVQLTAHAGGLKTLTDRRVLVRLLSLDDLLATQEMRPCLIPRTYDFELDSSHNGQGYEVKCDLQRLVWSNGSMNAAKLRDLVLQIARCDSVRDLLDAPDSPHQDPHLLHWKTLQSLAIRNDLLRLEPYDERESILRSLLTIWTLLPPSDVRQVRMAETLATSLLPQMESGVVGAWTEDVDVRLWGLMTGFLAISKHNPVRKLYAIRLKAMLRSTEIGREAWQSDRVIPTIRRRLTPLLWRRWLERAFYDDVVSLLHA